MESDMTVWNQLDLKYLGSKRYIVILLSENYDPKIIEL